MSLVSDLASGGLKGIGDGVAAIGGGITDFIAHVQGKLSPQEKAQLEGLASQAAQAQMSAQAKINEIEAANPNFFVSGWRPGVAWVCVIAFALNYLIYPIASWVLVLRHSDIKLPQLDISTMVPILVAMLGIGAYRTIEKNNGTTK